jgi:CheY-like chemotaxis protein
MQILNDVLDHSKIEAGKLELVQREVSLHALAASVAGLLSANAEAKGLGLRVEVGQCRADRVICDGQRLRQVLLNLVGNAVKFTEHGQVVLRLASRPADATHARVSFRVEDSGIGIAPEAQAWLFQPFHQIDGTPQRQHGGTGLGLSISQRIVEAMGGRIVIDSQPGRGSTFGFELRLEEAAPQAAPQAAADSLLGAMGGAETASGHVLVVEDNPVNRVIASEMLRSLGIESLEAENGALALECIARQRIDLVLMDCNMPVMDGYTAVERLREREARLGLARVPVVAMTANAFGEDVARALAAGLDGHLAKPYTRAQLRAAIERWV